MQLEGLDDLNGSLDDPIEGQEGAGEGGEGEGAGSQPDPINPDEDEPGDGEEGGEGGADGEGDGGEEGGDGSGEGTDNLSGIEKYLAKFGVEGGMIQFEDGEQTHFTELDPEKQAEILDQLHSMQATSLEDQYGLDETEIGLINYLRESGASIEEVIDQAAQQRAQAYVMAQQAESLNIDEMDDDTVYTSFILQNNPEATIEQIESDIAKAKEMSNYKNIVDGLRGDLKESQAQMMQYQQQQYYQQQLQEIEEQRQEVVRAVADLEEVDNLKINDGIKNDTLDLILNVDEDGDSLFMTQVFSDPHELFRAAFWYRNGKDIVQAREDFWKKEKSAAYKRGLEDAKKGRKTFSASDLKDNKTTPYLGASDDTVSLDELYT